MIIRARAPVRLSLASCGDTDYYIDLIKKGNALNSSISLYAYCEIHQRKDGKIILRSLETGQKLEYDSLKEIQITERELGLMKAVVKHYKNTGIEVITYTDAPLESGLGGSAAHTISMIKAFDQLNKIKRSKEELARLAYSLERDIVKVGGGYQDQYASAFRGINYMVFTKDGVKIYPVKLSHKNLKEFENNLLLVFVPRSKKGKDVHQEQKEKGIKNIEILKEKRKNVERIRNALESKKFLEVGKLLSLDWELKKKLAAGLTNKRIDDIYEKAIGAGAVGGRFIGAGAGGSAIFYCRNKEKVLKELEKMDVREIKFHFEGGDDD